MIFSHVQALLKGGRPQSAVLEAILPDVAEAWARAEPRVQREPAFATFLLTYEVVRHIVRTLDARGVEVLVLDGVSSRFALGDAQSREPSSVPELLIEPGRFVRSLAVLTEQGFEVVARNDDGALLRAPEIGVAVSLTCELRVAGFCALTARDLRARAHADESLLSLPVLLPDALDRYAYLVALATLQRVGQHHASLRELCELVGAEQLSAPVCARHLTVHGLAPAARYVMGLLDGAQRTHATQVLAALPPDPVADLMALLARLGVAHRSRSRALAVPFHLLEASKWQGARKLLGKLAAKATAQRRFASPRS